MRDLAAPLSLSRARRTNASWLYLGSSYGRLAARAPAVGRQPPSTSWQVADGVTDSDLSSQLGRGPIEPDSVGEGDQEETLAELWHAVDRRHRKQRSMDGIALGFEFAHERANDGRYPMRLPCLGRSRAVRRGAERAIRLSRNACQRSRRSSCSGRIPAIWTRLRILDAPALENGWQGGPPAMISGRPTWASHLGYLV